MFCGTLLHGVSGMYRFGSIQCARLMKTGWYRGCRPSVCSNSDLIVGSERRCPYHSSLLGSVLSATPIFCRRGLYTVAAYKGSEVNNDAEKVEQVFAKALLLSFLACQNRSFFASKCFVESVIEMYRRGYSLDSMKRIITFGTLAAGGMEQPMMQDIMLTWMTLVYLTLEEIGFSKYDGVKDMDLQDKQSDSMVEGLRGLAGMWIQKFCDEGVTLSGLQLQQSMQSISQQEQPGDFVKIMQQNARLVVLTLHIIRDSFKDQNVTVLPLPQEGEDGAFVPSNHYHMTGFFQEMIRMPDDPLNECTPEYSESDSHRRAAAIKLLLSFNGAALGYLMPAQTFVETAAYCYVSGWTADEIYLSLKQDEFVQSGGLVKVGRPPGGTNISATLFARWLAIVYMTMARIGIAHPKAAVAVGWAWVCSLNTSNDDEDEDYGGSLEAHGVFDFVSHTLASFEAPVEAQQETTRPDVDMDAVEEGELSGFSFRFEDPDLMKASGFALVLMQQEALTMISLSDLFLYACGFYVAKTLISFLTSNCDLRLLSKRDPPQGAFQGKVVWIVGASQGLGKGLALEWAKRGAKLILSSRNKETLLHVKEECSTVAPNASSISIMPFDITDTHDRIKDVVQNAFSEFGSIDYIVYNAGASQHAPVEETNDEVAKKLIEMNLIGQISLARASLGHFLKQGYGHHVVIASMAAAVPSPGQAVYAAAKSGLKSYFLSLSSELDSKGISVSVICPGPVDAGDQTQPRRVYGRNGMMEQKNSSKSSKRVNIDVFSNLALRAVYHKLDECWITKNPILFMGYLMQLMPGIAMTLLKKVGPGRVQQLDKGSGTGYEVVDMLKKQ